MDHQDWKNIVISKPSSVQKKPNVESKPTIVAPNEALDFSDKKIEYFTVEMGRKIASLRAQKKWTQDELAQKMCISKNIIVALEQGKEKYKGPFVSKLIRVWGNFTW